MFHSTYYGCNIYRNYRSDLRGEAYAGTHFVYADTLAGIRQLIKESKNNV